MTQEIAKLPDRFRYIKELGKGGMATVYLVHDTKLGRDIALKKLSTDLIGNRTTVQRFKREFEAISLFSHINIAAVYELIEEPSGEIYLVFEYVDGQSLSDVIAKEVSDGPSLTIDQKVAMILQVAKALAHAHSKGVMHRDIKPSNIMITSDGVIKLLDFGIARQETSEALTLTAEVCGTPLYMAPEQILKKNVDYRADIYSFGILFFELLASRPPFHSEVIAQIVNMHLIEQAPKITEFVKDTPRWIELMIAICLDKKPENRYKSMDDIIASIMKHTQPKRSGGLIERIKSSLGLH